MKWTQKELEELYSKVNERALKDSEFREKVIKDVRAALEEVAGCELPEELGLKYIEKDDSYRSIYVTPDFAQGEIDVKKLRDVSGGAGGYAQSGDYKKKQTSNNDISVFLIVSVCGAAAQVGPDAGLCGFAACPADACAAQACGGKVCGGFACGGQGCAAKASGADACGAQACGEKAAIAEVCGHDVCGADVDIVHMCAGGYACGAQAVGIMACTSNVCGAEADVLEVCTFHGCGARAAGAQGCVADANIIGACGAKADVVGLCGGDACGAEACGIEGCGVDVCGADINGTGIEYISVCNTDAMIVDKPFGYDIPSSGIDICGTKLEGIVSDEAAVNDAE